MDNQLLGTTQPVMLCVTPGSSDSGASDSGPALQVNSVKVPSSLMLTDLYKVSASESHGLRLVPGFLCTATDDAARSQHLMVTARRFTVIIEEKLLLKLLSFFGYGQTEAGGSCFKLWDVVAGWLKGNV